MKFPQSHSKRTRVGGYSLIEFLIAGALGAVVLAAAGTAYFNAMRIKQAGESRLQQQQDWRFASQQLRQDAQKAGSFACFQSGNSDNLIIDTRQDFTALSFKQGGAVYDTGVKILPASKLNIPNFQATSSALLFTYGSDLNDVEQAFRANPQAMIERVALRYPHTFDANTSLVASSCHVLQKLDSARVGTRELSRLQLDAQHQDEELAILRYRVVAYLTGKPAGVVSEGLYRVEWKTGNQWHDPQLLMNQVGKMHTEFAYVENCGGTLNQEQFRLQNQLKTQANSPLPAWLRLRVQATGDKQQAVYVLQSSMRGGNLCAHNS